MTENQTTGMIQWDEINGQGFAILTWEDGTQEKQPCDEAINASADSHSVASLFGRFASVEHDGAYIHVSR